MHKVDRRRAWQLKMAEAGRCARCGRRKPKGERRIECATCRRRRKAARLSRLARAEMASAFRTQ